MMRERLKYLNHNTSIYMFLAIGVFVGFGFLGAIMAPPVETPENGFVVVDRFFSPGQGIEYLIKLVSPDYQGIELSLCMGC